MLTYKLFNTQTTLLSATGIKDQQMLTYSLFKTQNRFLSAASRKGLPDADSHPVQNPEHPVISNKQEGSAIC
jgi:hypothetical protein